jgi:hypothetical protein
MPRAVKMRLIANIDDGFAAAEILAQPPATTSRLFGR